MDEETQKKTKNNLSLYLAIAAILISVIGTGISVVEAMIMKDQQTIMHEQKSASVWPYVIPSKSLSADQVGQVIQVKYTNNGVGPALMGLSSISYNGKPIKRDQLSGLISQDLSGYNVVQTTNVNSEGTVIAAEEEYIFVEIKVIGMKMDLEGLNAVSQVLSQISVEYCYCSIYQDCWMSSTEGSPIRTTHCNTKIVM